MSNLAYLKPKPAEPPHLDDQLCAYCYPAMCFAHFWDAEGYACCNICGAKADRACLMPKAFLRYLWPAA